MRLPSWLCTLAARLPRVLTPQTRRRRTFRPRLESLEDRITPTAAQLTNLNFADGPKYLTPVGSTLYFVANDGTHGEQLWRTDGQPGDAVPVQSGSQPVDPGDPPNEYQQVAQIGPWLYFFSDNTDGTYTLWRNNSSVVPTGGTSPSQALVSLDADPEGGPDGNGPYELTAVGHDLYFGAYSADAGGYQMWKTTGADGANPVTAPFLFPGADLNGPWAIKAVGSSLYFSADLVQNGTTNIVLWGSDGTIAGTAPIQDGSGGYVPGVNWNLVNSDRGLTSFATVDNDLYYISGGFQDILDTGILWKISGPGTTAEEIATVGHIPVFAGGIEGSSGYQMTAVGDTLYFATGEPQSSNGYIIWKCEGSTVSEVGQTTAYESSLAEGYDLVQIVGLGSNAYFLDTPILDQGLGLYFPRLWKADGTPGGTQLVESLDDNGSFDSTTSPWALTVAGTDLYLEDETGQI